MKIKNIIIKLLKVIIKLSLVILVLYNTLFTIGHTDKIVKLGKKYFYVVKEDSMAPKIKKYDFVVLSEAQNSELKINDVVLYNESKNIRLHRIINVNENLYITKADANIHEDLKGLSKDQIRFKVNKVYKKIGFFFNIMQSKIITFFIILGLILMLITNRMRFVKSKMRRKNINRMKFEREP